MNNNFRQQTIITSIDSARLHETKTDDNESYYTSTDFDDKVMDFVDGVLSEGGGLIQMTHFATSEYVGCIITYVEKLQSSNIEVPDFRKM